MIIRFSLILLGVLLSGYIIPGIAVSGLYTAFIVGTLFVIANITIKPLLFIITLPIHFITLGLSAFFINVFIFWFLSTFIQGFTVTGFIPALLGSLVMAFVGALGARMS